MIFLEHPKQIQISLKWSSQMAKLKLPMFLGYQAGYILQVYPGHRDRLTRWLAWSLLTGGLGALLSGGSQEGGWVPINKNLWSISFVLVTSCFAFPPLAALYVLIDLKHWWKGQPFFYAG